MRLSPRLFRALGWCALTIGLSAAPFTGLAALAFILGLVGTYYLLPQVYPSRISGLAAEDSASQATVDSLIRARMEQQREDSIAAVEAAALDIVGLLTFGGYYKELRNIDFLFKYVEQDREADFFGFTMLEPVNVEGTTEIYGTEVELQTNLRFLPGPLDGIVFFGNYSHIWSDTRYPYQVQTGYDPVTFIPVVADTFRTGPMPGQADDILNLALGYEKGGFSGRLSLNYQGSNLHFLGAREELDGWSDSYRRWDLALTQRVRRYATVFLNIANLTDLPERAFLGAADFPTREEFFGLSASLGVRVTY